MDALIRRKRHLRARIREQKLLWSPEEEAVRSACIRAHLLALPELQQAQNIFCYVSIAGEPDTKELIEALLRAGKQVSVPKCLGEGRMEARRIRSLDVLRPTAPFGIPEPAGDAPLQAPEEIDFVLVPGLAFDLRGGRLGKGAGYYDRYLPHVRGFKCGVCFHDGLVEQVPISAHDIRMDLVLSEQGVHRLTLD